MMKKIELSCSTGVVSVEQLPSLVERIESLFPEIGEEIVVLSGRMPVWVFATATHVLHPTKGVATFDPRLGGGVVVAQHHEDCPPVGTIIPCTGDETVIEVTV